MDQSITQLSPDLWVAQSGLYDTNSGIFLRRDRACLIDPGIYPGEIAAIAALVAERGAIPESMVLTHAHWDHVLGPEQLPRVPIIAQAGYLPAVEGARGERIVGQVERWAAEAGVSRLLPFSCPIPGETFTTHKVLMVADLELRLVHAPGHAPDQLVVYQPESATLWAADMLSDLEIPFVFDSLAAYRQTLAQIAAWDIQLLIPGHGHPTADVPEIRTRLDEDRAYLDELHSRVEAALQQGRTEAETVEFCEGMHFRYPQDNAGPHRQNVERAYRELQEAGVGHG